MGEWRAKTILANSGTFKDNQTYPGIIPAYSDIFRTRATLTYLKLWYIQNPNIFKTTASSQTSYILNPAIFRTLAYPKSKAYSEPVAHLR